MVKCPDENDTTFMDKAAERLRRFEDARAPQELPDNLETDANKTNNEAAAGKKENTDKTADSVRQQDNRLSENENNKL